jgi:hypothetical protein
VSKLTEEQMSKEFEKLLKNSDYFDFSSVFKEVSSFKGIPDFVAISCDSKLGADDIVIDKDLASVESSSIILAMLKKKSGRTLKYIMKYSGISEKVSLRTLDHLIEVGIVKKNKNNLFLLGDKWVEPETEIWAFELKLSNWKRALYQALQYKAFAHRVLVVFPSDKEKLIRKNLEAFKKFKIGVVIFDSSNNKMIMLSKPVKLKPASKSHNLYVIQRLQQEMSE